MRTELLVNGARREIDVEPGLAGLVGHAVKLGDLGVLVLQVDRRGDDAPVEREDGDDGLGGAGSFGLPGILHLLGYWLFWPSLLLALSSAWGYLRKG